jgi:hypothetical protein
LNTTMFTSVITFKCGFGYKCLAFVWAFLFHARTSTSPTHKSLALFHWKGRGRFRLAPLLITFGLPISCCWFFLFRILPSNHGDNIYNYMTCTTTPIAISWKHHHFP